MAPSAVIEVLLVDDHEVVRAGLRALLEDVEGIAISGEAASVAQAVEAARRLRPDVILMDLRLPDGTGLDACREILSGTPQTRILFLTSHSDEQAIASTILAGAAGYLLKDIGHNALVDAIRDAAGGRPVLNPKLTRPVAERMQQAESLSAQERRVVALVVEGKTNKEIAAALGLSDKTVKNYLANAFQKLGVTRRAQAAALFAGGRIGQD
jgi:two-component system, NarL family, response regulator DevR